MKSHERQEQIIAQLLNHGIVRLVELCERFQVSEGTIRNDLRGLELQGRLIRTHGGAVPVGIKHPLASKRQARLSEANGASPDGGDVRRAVQIQNIAHRAADLVSEGDLIGGRVHLNRDSLGGQAASGMLDRMGMRVSKAFIACDGVSAAQGFASNDIDDAQVKAGMVACADTVVMLAPGDAVGKLALLSFAGLNQAHHLVTTNDVAPDALNMLISAGVRVSLCGEHITELCTDRPPQRKWRIGFANLTEAQDFAVTVRQSFEKAAIASGNVELILTDNKSNPQAALENARRMLDAKVDLVVEYQQDEKTNYILMDLFRSEGVPVIAVDIPTPGAVYFGADNYRAGRIAGEAAASWIRQHWAGKLDKVVCLEQGESGSVPAARIQGSLVTLRSIFPLKDSDIVSFDTHGTLEQSRSAALQALRNIPWGRNVLFIGINANSAIGALEAAEALGRQSCTAVVSQNATNRIRYELQQRNPMLIGAVDYFPGSYGERVLHIAEAMLTSKPVLPATYTDHLLITSANVQRMYPDDHHKLKTQNLELKTQNSKLQP